MNDSMNQVIEQLKQTETTMLPIIIELLDAVFELSAAARRSDSRNLHGWIKKFEDHCRICAERIDLKAFAPTSGTPFNATLYSLTDSNQIASANSIVAETVHCGYLYHGQVIRQASVLLK